MDLEEAARLLIDEYGRMARVYDVQAAPRHAPLVERVLELAELESGMTVIDVGCGTGNLAFEAVERVGHDGLVAGIDAALGAILVATEKAERRHLDKVRFEAMDARHLRYEDETIDAVLSCLGIPTVGRVECFAEVRRVLRPDGRFVFCEWSGAGNPITKAYFDTLAKYRAARPPVPEVARLLEARRVINGDPDVIGMRKPEAWVQKLEALGFRGARYFTEAHTTTLRDAAEYLSYMLAWGDNERELRSMTSEMRESFVKDLARRVEPLLTSQGIAISREAHFCMGWSP